MFSFSTSGRWQFIFSLGITLLTPCFLKDGIFVCFWALNKHWQQTGTQVHTVFNLSYFRDKNVNWFTYFCPSLFFGKKQKTLPRSGASLRSFNTFYKHHCVSISQITCYGPRKSIWPTHWTSTIGKGDNIIQTSQ